MTHVQLDSFMNAILVQLIEPPGGKQTSAEDSKLLEALLVLDPDGSN